MDGVALLTIFVLSIFVGFEVVSKVSTILHTPLMSGANAIHGIVLIGGITVTGAADSVPEVIIGDIAIRLRSVTPLRVRGLKRWGTGTPLGRRAAAAPGAPRGGPCN